MPKATRDRQIELLEAIHERVVAIAEALHAPSATEAAVYQKLTQRQRDAKARHDTEKLARAQRRLDTPK